MLPKVFRPNLIVYINLSKVFDNYTRRCECTSGESRVGLVCEETSNICTELSSLCAFLNNDFLFLIYINFTEII